MSDKKQSPPEPDKTPAPAPAPVPAEPIDQAEYGRVRRPHGGIEE